MSSLLRRLPAQAMRNQVKRCQCYRERGTRRFPIDVDLTMTRLWLWRWNDCPM